MSRPPRRRRRRRRWFEAQSRVSSASTRPSGGEYARCEICPTRQRENAVVEKGREMITPKEWAALSAVDMFKRLREEGARSGVTQKEIAAAICKCVGLLPLDRYLIAVVEEVGAWTEDRLVNFQRLNAPNTSSLGRFLRQIINDKISVANAADLAWETAKQILSSSSAYRLVRGEITDATMRVHVEPLWTEDKMLAAMDQEEARLYLIGPEGRGGRLDTCAPEERDRLEEWAVRLDDPEQWVTRC